MNLAYQLNAIKVIRDERCLLDIPNLDLAAGKCIALLGDNGAGKSTLLDLLAFITQPSEGKISLLGERINKVISTEQRQKIAYVAQHPLLLDGTISDNLRLALKLQNIDKSKHQTLEHEALALVNLTHLANQKASSLSGGELRRAAIARAICYQPSIILLDEPFSHLDQNHVVQLENIISRLSKQANKTVIFSTHNRLQGTALADSTLNLVNGKITESPLLNVFSGHITEQLFNTGNIRIHTNSSIESAQHIAIHPNEIIIAHHRLESSMRNQFSGRLTAITQEENAIRLTIDCGEQFHALISHESLTELNLTIGALIWLSFKSSAVSLF